MVMMKVENKHTDLRTQWNFFWWVLGTIFAPIAVPYFILEFWNHFRAKKVRNDLPGKVVLITGASSGLGEALSHVFYKAGCRLILTGRREQELERVKEELLGLHLESPTYPPVVVPLDLAELNSLPRKVENALAIFGHIDILVNNAGVSVRSDILSTSVDVDIKIMLVNYFGGVALTKATLPSMIKRRSGRVVFISSVQGKFSIPFRSAYSASKHAVQAFCDCLRVEVSDYNVKVTCISPGYIKTCLSQNALTGDGGKYGVLDNATNEGTPAIIMAEKILNAILRDKKDVIIAQLSGRIAYYLRLFLPSIYFWIMTKRARKLHFNPFQN